MNLMTKIAPSIASGPLTNLGKTIRELESAGADVIHFDIEDGNFVPAMNLGVKIIRELRPLTKLPFDVHLMVSNPEWLLPELAEIGVDSVSVHFEACAYLRRTLKIITKLGMRAGLAFNPATEIPGLAFCQPYLAFILVLSTDPEIGDCPFLKPVLTKVSYGKYMHGLEGVEWMVDGGISTENVEEVIKSGADTIIVGRGVFSSGKITENMLELRKICNRPE